MAVQTRELAVSYGGTSLSTANGCYLTADRESYRLKRAYPEGFFSVEFLVILASPTGTTATDNASFGSLCSTIETALRKPNQRLIVTLGATTLADVNPSSSARTGYAIRGEVEKVGSDDDSGRTRRYRFTCTFRLRADLSGQNNRTPEASTEIGATITSRRTVIATASWKGSASTTALAEYTTNGDTYFATVLPTNVSSGEWVLVDSNPRHDDENAELTVTRTYWEVVSGLRENEVIVSYNASRIRTVVIVGMYTKTASSTALENFTNNIATLQSGIMTALGVTSFNVVPSREERRYDQTAEQYFFTRVLEEIVYAQATSTDDSHVVAYSLDVSCQTPFIPRTVTTSIRPEQLKTYKAIYQANIDKDQSTDPNGIWTSKLRSHCISAVNAKLNASGIAVEFEEVAVSPNGNVLSAALVFTAKGSDVIQLMIRERITNTSAVNPRPRADGNPHSYFLFRQPPQRVLFRSAMVEYVGGSTRPPLFRVGDQASGFDLVNTGQDALDAQANLEKGILPSFPGWLIVDVEDDVSPVTRGQNEEFSVHTLTRSETWLYVASLEQASNAVAT